MGQSLCYIAQRTGLRLPRVGDPCLRFPDLRERFTAPHIDIGITASGCGMESNRPHSAPLVAARGSIEKERTGMPRWFTRNDNGDFGGKPSPEEAAGEPKRRKRRLATTFVFTTLFFAGASLAAFAGDRFSATIAEDNSA